MAQDNGAKPGIHNIVDHLIHITTYYPLPPN